MLAPFLIMVCAPVPAVGMERPTHQGAAQSSSHNSDLSPHSSDHPFGPQRTLFEHNHLWGYRDQHGRVVIPAQFPMAEDFSKQGLAAVVMGDHWALIDHSGREVLRPLPMDNGPDPFQEGLARLISGGRIGFYDDSGRIVIKPQFDFAWPFADGLSAVCMECRKVPMGEHYVMEGGAWGLINRTGRIVLPIEHPSPDAAILSYKLIRK